MINLSTKGAVSDVLKDTRPGLLMTERANRLKRIGSLSGYGFLFLITSVSAFAVLFIFYFIIKDAVPFFEIRGIAELFTNTHWYPSAEDPEFGALAILIGSALVTFGAVFFAVVLGLPTAVYLSDVVSFKLRQFLKPVIEILAAIPSVAYGFFALVVFAPVLQKSGGRILSITVWFMGIPLVSLIAYLISEFIASRVTPLKKSALRMLLLVAITAPSLAVLYFLGNIIGEIEITSGTNALNVSIVLGIMALPTVVSVSEDSLQAIGRDLREGSYAVGATRAETIIRVVIPAARSGLWAAVILGVMRAIGETMVVWMASGNAAQIPSPIYNFMEPVRTLTATIAGDMGEADQVTGSVRYHVLFALALCLLVFSFLTNLASEWVVRRSKIAKG
jgi:phosphate transport system permease protein